MSDTFRYVGALRTLPPADRARLVERAQSRDERLTARVAGMLERVRREGDAALRALARELDGVDLPALEVPRERRREALASLDPALRAALEHAHRNIAAFHRGTAPGPLELETEPGVRVGRRPDPLGRVGVYCPGGRAAYPSTALMCAVPARVAGVGEVVLCSPPAADGLPARTILAAAELAGVDRVFAVGGAGAIAAMAFGTESVPRADRIVGPGNAWVAEAKLQVVGTCSIDAPAGPSEILILADGTADPDTVARELFAQAEHDPDAWAAVVSWGDGMAPRIAAAVECRLAEEPRRDVIAAALAARGVLIAASGPDEALAFASEFAPEHLLLLVADPDRALRDVRNAGTVLLGEDSSVVFGDYLTGANHTLPTGGRARSYSGLSTLDFVRWTSWQRVSRAAAQRLAGDAACLAAAEGFPAHAAAARSRS